MRDLLFKNFTSSDRKRRILVSSEIMDKQGVHSIIHRHFVYIVKEIKDKEALDLKPSLYVLKEHNTREQKERFFCRVKGGICTAHKGRLFLILFVHSLKICLTRIKQDSLNYL